MISQISYERQHSAVTTLQQARLIFSEKSFLKRLGLGFFVQFGNQCTGTLVISNYNAQLFSGLGITGGTALLLLGFFNLTTVPGNFFNGLFVHRFGRRPCVLVGCIDIILCLSCEAALASQFVETKSTNQVGLGFGVFFIFFFVVFYCSCLDATMYLVPSEIFPMVLRSLGMSFSIVEQFEATTILLESAPLLSRTLATMHAGLVYVFLPETKGMTLEDISVRFGDPAELSFEQALHIESAAQDPWKAKPEQVESWGSTVSRLDATVKCLVHSQHDSEAFSHTATPRSYHLGMTAPGYELPFLCHDMIPMIGPDCDGGHKYAAVSTPSLPHIKSPSNQITIINIHKSIHLAATDQSKRR